MLDLINTLNLDKNLKQKIGDLAQTDKVKILYLAYKCSKGNFSCLKNKNPLLTLAVMIECAGRTKEKYEALGICDDILYDTLDDIRIWCENNNNNGLKNYNWIKNHISVNLFKIGRLQFQMLTCKNRTLNYSKLPFSYGDNIIYVHIPQGEKLIYKDCIHSINMAVDFFEKYFPAFKYKCFFCESWLLYEGNKLFMDSNSNIIQFASLFHIAYSVGEDAQAIERIYGHRCLNKQKYQENTSLQRRAKAHMLKGGKLGIGIGYIDMNDIFNYSDSN
ncbi:MAG: acyltransferase domain-containing protein [Clostridium sp.]|nr:acyltransferase domain-containing protein [Clostridium sp.]